MRQWGLGSDLEVEHAVPLVHLDLGRRLDGVRVASDLSFGQHVAASTGLNLHRVPGNLRDCLDPHVPMPILHCVSLLALQPSVFRTSRRMRPLLLPPANRDYPCPQPRRVHHSKSSIMQTTTTSTRSPPRQRMYQPHA